MKFSKLVVSWVFMMVSFQAGAAVDQEEVFLRAKAGPSFHSNTGSISSGFGLGLDMGFNLGGRFGFIASGMINPEDRTSEYSSSSSSDSTTKLETKYFGAGPTFAVGKGLASMTVGLQVGVLSLNSEVSTTLIQNKVKVESSSSKVALAPHIDMNIRIIAGLLGTVSLKYIAALGDSPNPSVFYPTAGVGYQF